MGYRERVVIAGSINSNRELVMPIRVLDANQHAHRVEAVVDTGFEGYLSLSPDWISDLGLRFVQHIDMVVATGRIFQVNSYHGIVIWRGQRRPIRILEAEGRPLIGINLLWNSLLTAEITDNGTVNITPLPTETAG